MLMLFSLLRRLRRIICTVHDVCVCAVYYVHRAAYISLLIYVPILVLVTITGLAMHALYAHCDPLVNEHISSGDQVKTNIIFSFRTVQDHFSGNLKFEHRYKWCSG